MKDGVRPCFFSAGILRLPETEEEESGKRGSLTPGLEGSEEDLGLVGGPRRSLPKLEEMPYALTFSLYFIFKK